LSAIETVICLAKKRLQITVRDDLVRYVDEQVEKLRFASRSHAIEYALTQLKERDRQERKTRVE
jgi:Arc/MetJ-type ribon-helix-helix transcriptional regulator